MVDENTMLPAIAMAEFDERVTRLGRSLVAAFTLVASTATLSVLLTLAAQDAKSQHSAADNPPVVGLEN